MSKKLNQLYSSLFNHISRLNQYNSNERHLNCLSALEEIEKYCAELEKENRNLKKIIHRGKP